MKTSFANLTQNLPRWTRVCLGCTLLALLPLAASAATATTTWTGASSTAWALAGNWTGAAIPANQNLLCTFNGAAANGNRTINIAGTARNSGGARFDSSGAAADGFTFTTATANIGIRICIDGIVNNDDDAQEYRVPIQFNSTGGTAANGLTAPINAIGGNLNFNIAAFASGTTIGALNSDGAAAVFAFNAASGKTITVGAAGTPGLISGTTGTGTKITKDGAGTLTLLGTAANTFSGGATINAGTLTAGKANALGTGTLAANGGTLDIGANSQSVGAVTVAGGTINGTSGTLTGTSYGLQSGTVNAKLGGAVALTKTTTGTATLGGANTYSGSTTISAGTLALGASGSIANSANIILNGGTFDVSLVTGGFSLGSSQTLKGNGNITGGMTANGTVAPGASIGTIIESGALTLSPTAILNMEINTAGDQADKITASSIVEGGTLNIVNIGSSLQVGDTFDLFDGTLSLAFGLINEPSLPDSSWDWDLSGLAPGGNGVVIVVPEPSTVAFIGLGIAALLILRRRR